MICSSEFWKRKRKNLKNVSPTFFKLQSILTLSICGQRHSLIHSTTNWNNIFRFLLIKNVLEFPIDTSPLSQLAKAIGAKSALTTADGKLSYSPSDCTLSSTIRTFILEQTFLSSWCWNQLSHNGGSMVSGTHFCSGVKSWCCTSAA